jgi:hypothetical protein
MRQIFLYLTLIKIQFFFRLAPHSKSGLGRLIFEVPVSHARTHPVGLLWTGDQPVAKAVTYTAHNKQNRRMSMSLGGF